MKQKDIAIILVVASRGAASYRSSLPAIRSAIPAAKGGSQWKPDNHRSYASPTRYSTVKSNPTQLICIAENANQINRLSSVLAVDQGRHHERPIRKPPNSRLEDSLIADEIITGRNRRAGNTKAEPEHIPSSRVRCKAASISNEDLTNMAHQ